MRSPFLAAVPPSVALSAGLVRWWLQGSGNLYTATARRAYVPDPDLGWRVVDGGPPWLGLEVLAVIAAVGCAVVAGAWLVRRLERGGAARRGLRGGLWVVGAAPLLVPIWAFAGGLGPDGARDALPAGHRAVDLVGITGALDAPAGRWEVVAHDGSAVTARLAAGGESFDARFARGIAGHWTGDPRDLTAPMSAEVTVPTASVDTGVTARSNSARDDYLDAAGHPTIGFRLERLTAATATDDGVAFHATGAIALLGREHQVELDGGLRLLDQAARTRLGLDPSIPAMLAEADLRLPIRDTALASDAGDFDVDEIPLHVSLVLVHRPQPEKP